MCYPQRYRTLLWSYSTREPGVNRSGSLDRGKRMPIGVAFIVGQLSLGGAEQQLYYFLSGLDRSHFRPVVITLGPKSDEYWVQPIVSLGIPVLHVPRRLGRALRTFRIAAILRCKRVQMVHGWDLHTNPYSAVAGRLAGTPVRLGSMRFNYEVILTEKLVRWMGYRGLDVMVANSTVAANQLRELRLTKAKVRLLPNGVPIPEIVSEGDRLRLKSELGFSSADLVIGSIGRLDVNKNYAMLLRVFAALITQWKRLRLVIIGDGPLKSELVAMAQALGIAAKVSLPGAIPLAARYLPAMDACCLTSYTEGMPNVIMEAAAAGLPVVSTRCGDSGDLIEDGVSGYLVSRDDDVRMSARLDRLLTYPQQRSQMGQAAREKMRREFSVNSMVAGMTRLYEEVLAEKRLACVRPRTEA